MYQPYPGHETQLPETQRPPAPASVLTAVVFLWRRASSAYFRSTAA
jgi:hypothetical protein